MLSKLHNLSDITSFATWAVAQDGAAASVNTVSKAAAANKAHVISAVEVSFSGAATSAVVTITINDGATTIWKTAVPSGSAIGTSWRLLLPVSLKITTGNQLSVSCSSGGAGCISTICVMGTTI